MNIEIMVISYALICFALLFATIVLIPARFFHDKRLDKNIQKYENHIFNVLNTKFNDEETMEFYLKEKLKLHKLSDYRLLMAFLFAYKDFQETQSKEDIALLQRSFQPTFAKLCSKYGKENTLIKTYFIYAIGVIFNNVKQIDPKIQEFLIVSMRTNSIYCRQNALSTVCKLGDAVYVARVLNIVNRNFNEYSPKLIGDSLVETACDVKELANELLQNFDSYKIYLKLAVLNFIRFTQNGFDDFMLDILTDENQHFELKIIAIRYFARNKDDRAYEVLINHLQDTSDDARMDIKAICASALANYPGKQTFEILKKALNHYDWYVRLNASISLEILGFDYHQMVDVLSGKDRYAREIINYRLERQKKMKIASI